LKVELELWHLILLLLAFFGCVGGFGKLLLSQVETRLSERFAAQDAARDSSATQIREALVGYAAQVGATAQQVLQLERDLMSWKADLPIKYVLREDYIRGQTVLEAKQDALYTESKMIQMQLAKLVGRQQGEA